MLPIGKREYRKVRQSRMPKYAPLVSSIVQSKFGYWIVTISAAPGLNVSVMVAKLGITPAQAADAALAGLPPLTTPARYA